MAFVSSDEHLGFGAAPWGYALRGRVSGGGMLGQVKALFAFGCGFAGGVILLMPGAELSLDIWALKAALAFTLIMVAIVLWRGSRSRTPETVEIDYVRREVRVLVERRLRRRYRFDELGDIEIDGAILNLTSVTGTHLERLELNDADLSRLPL